LIANLTDVSARLPVVVTVDAMSLNPVLTSQNGERMNRVLGAVDTIEVSDQQMIEYSTSLGEFENWTKKQFPERNHQQIRVFEAAIRSSPSVHSPSFTISHEWESI
jgi:hypothetical protein